MKRKKECGIVVILFLVSVFILSICAKVEAGDNFLVEKMRLEFKEKVRSNLELDGMYLLWVEKDVERLISMLPAHDQVSQFFHYIDRNPAKQMGILVWYDSVIKKVSIIGADKVSTGNPKRKGHFQTPVGVFANTVSSFSYRAEGTKNKRGWRGLGAKGSRVWDFGWQNTVHSDGIRSIRLLMHATDPENGEVRLGKVDSKGCIRISAKMNQFLDQFGILDADYEARTQEKRIQWILRKDRIPVNYAGKYLLIGESI